MKKFLLLLLWTVFLTAEKYNFDIHSITVATEKENSKSWDAFGGKPDVIVSIFKTNNSFWYDAYRSSVYADTNFIGQIKNVAQFSLNDKIKIVVTDKDLKGDDVIGEIELTITAKHLNKTETTFGGVTSFVFELTTIPLSYKEKRVVQDVEYFLQLAQRSQGNKRIQYVAQAKEKFSAFSPQRLSHPAIKKLQKKLDSLSVKKSAHKNVALDYKSKKSIANIKWFLQTAERTNDIDVLSKHRNQIKTELDALISKYSKHSQVKPLIVALQTLEKRIASQNKTVENTVKVVAIPKKEVHKKINPKDSIEKKEELIEKKSIPLGYREKKALKNVEYYINLVPKNISYIESTLKNPRSTAKHVDNAAQQARKNIKYANDELQNLEKTHGGHSEVIAMRKKIHDFEQKIKNLLDSGNTKDLKKSQQIVQQANEAIAKMKEAYYPKEMRFNSDKAFLFYKEIRIISQAMSSNATAKETLQTKLTNFTNTLAKNSNEKLAGIKKKIQLKEKWNLGVKQYIDPLKEFGERNKKLHDFLQQMQMEAILDFVKNDAEKIEQNGKVAQKFVDFLNKCWGISTTISKSLADFRKKEIAEAKRMIGDDTLLLNFLEHSIKMTSVFKNVDTQLKKLRTDLLQRIEKASKKAAKEGFDKFRDSHKAVVANRKNMLQNPEKYQDKIIANAKFSVASWNTKGWYLSHGDEMFSYVWDKKMSQKFLEIEKKYGTIYKKFKAAILRENKLSKDREIHWKYPGLVDIEFVAIVEGTTPYSHIDEVLDSRGNVILRTKRPPVQIVNARVVGIKSRYFTFWIDGSDCSEHINISGLPRK